MCCILCTLKMWIGLEFGSPRNLTMASHFLKLIHPLPPYPNSDALSLPFLAHQIHHPTLSLQRLRSIHTVSCAARSPRQSSQPPVFAPPAPPSTRDEAVLQAKTSLSAALQKPLNNLVPALPARKLRRPQQPRLRVEIPVADNSPGSLARLASDVFSDIPLTKNGSKPTILILCADPTLLEPAHQSFPSIDSVIHSDLNSVTPTTLLSADLAVFLAPEASQLAEIKAAAEGLSPKPVVLFNPRWGFDEEEEKVAAALRSFLGSFDVVYSFMGLEVRGILSRKKGVVFRCARDGVVGRGDGWVVMVEGEGSKGELKTVSRFKRRPSIGEVENLLYNLMAANSPVTKSVKFLQNLAANVTGKKEKQ